MGEPKWYVKKPVEVEAMLFDGTTPECHAVYRWIEENTLGSFEPMAVLEGREPCPESGVSIDPRNGNMIIATLEGYHAVTPGDYVIRGIKGEFYPCKPDIFEQSYTELPTESVPDGAYFVDDLDNPLRSWEFQMSGGWVLENVHVVGCIKTADGVPITLKVQAEGRETIEIPWVAIAGIREMTNA